MSDDQRKPATRAVHLGRIPRKYLGAVNTPVFRASTMLFPTVAELEQAARGEYAGIGYGLHGLPTVTDLQDTVAAIEGAHRGARGAVGAHGDDVAAARALEGGRPRARHRCGLRAHAALLQQSSDRGSASKSTYYDPLLGAAIEREFRPNTRVVFTESPGSLTFCVQDIPAIAAVAHRRGALVITDNSWATPFGFRSFDHGVDVSVHAATKYIGGHSDVLFGLILANEATFPALHRLWTDMGVTASPDDCFLALRGLRTLPLRLARHVESALRIARWLQARPEVREVIYPALPGSRGHELWKRDFIGASGLFAVVLQPVAKARDRRHARPHAPLRHGLELGRLREPHDSDLSGARADGHEVGCGRAVPAPCHRARGSRRPDRGPGRGTRPARRVSAARSARRLRRPVRSPR